MLKLTATFEIVTPMFLGDAEQQATRIRESSIKGALVFWWRALNYPNIAEDENARTKEYTPQALKALQKREQKLFGGPSGQGVFLMKVRPWQPNKFEKGHNFLENFESGKGLGAVYLGYGVLDRRGRFARTAFQHGQSFFVEIVFKPNAPNDQISEILDSLKIMGLLGGIGSRVRRGWGSLCLRSIISENSAEFSNWTAPKDTESYKSEILSLIKPTQLSGSGFSLSAFSGDSKIRIGSETFKNALLALDHLGEGMRKYRGWQNNPEQNFRSDHDWFKQPQQRQQDPFIDNNKNSWNLSDLPRRAVFGLPHNYFSPAEKNGGTELKMKIDGPNDQESRRASPLLFHIHLLSRDKPAFGVVTHFRTKFLKSSSIKVDGHLKEFRADHRILDNFLEGNQPNGTASAYGEYFPSESLCE